MSHFEFKQNPSLKEIVGVLIKDSPRYLPALYGSQKTVAEIPQWIRLTNRHEKLSLNPAGYGVLCNWLYTSRLHACEVIQSWGQCLMKHAFTNWPVVFSNKPALDSPPVISFIFAHQGHDRLAQLIQVIRSIFAQVFLPVEIIIIDLTLEPLEAELPKNIIYKHIATSHLQPGWRKSWGYNIGAHLASGKILVFHDGDICVPYHYVRELSRWLIENTYEVASIQRFLFYLSKECTDNLIQNQYVQPSVVDAVLQNWRGGTVAIRRDSFFKIGGFDEGFVNWGGEDIEFFDRCSTLKHLKFGYLPFIHLWHEPQPGRNTCLNINLTKVLPERLAVPKHVRCSQLMHRNFGDQTKPEPAEPYFTVHQRELT